MTKPKRVRDLILVYLLDNGEKTISDISRNTCCTFSSVIKNINELEKLEMITKEALDGRSKNIILTKNGIEFANTVKKYYKLGGE